MFFKDTKQTLFSEEVKPVGNFSDESYFLSVVAQYSNLTEAFENDFLSGIEKVRDAFDPENRWLSERIHKMCSMANDLSTRTANKFCSKFSDIYSRNKNEVEEMAKKAKSYHNYAPLVAPEPLYTYTIVEGIPSVGVLEDLEDDLYEVHDILKDSGSFRTAALLVSDVHDELYDEIYGNQYYSKARKKLLKASKGISKENFALEIFNTFRKGGEQDPSCKVTDENVRAAAKRYFEYPKRIESIKKELKAINARYDSLINKSKELAIYCARASGDEELVKAYNKYLRLKQDQIYHVAQMHTMVFAGKMDAIAKSYEQDVMIIKLAEGGKE